MGLEQVQANVNVMMVTLLNHAMNVMKDFIKIRITVLKLAVSVSFQYIAHSVIRPIVLFYPVETLYFIAVVLLDEVIRK